MSRRWSLNPSGRGSATNVLGSIERHSHGSAGGSELINSHCGVSCSVVALLVSGCTGNSNKSASSGLGTDLALLSDEITLQVEPSDTLTIDWYSLDRYGKAVGSDLSTENARVEFLTSEESRVLLPPNFFRFGTLEATEKELGFSRKDAISALELQIPPLSVAVVRGSFDKTKLETALGPEQDGIRSIGPKKDYEIDPLSSSAIRQLGMGLRVTQIDDALVVSTNRSIVAKLIATPKSNLASQSPWRELAAELDSRNAYAAWLVANQNAKAPPFGVFNDADNAEKLVAEYEKTLIERPTAIGVGFTGKNGAALVYTHGSESAAEINEKLLGTLLTDGVSNTSTKPLREYFTVKAISRNKTTVIVELTTDRPEFLRGFLLSGDTGFASK
jgi:hypothetical protein